MIAGSLTIVATELAQDPLLKTIVEASNDGTVAQMLAKVPSSQSWPNPSSNPCCARTPARLSGATSTHTMSPSI